MRGINCHGSTNLLSEFDHEYAIMMMRITLFIIERCTITCNIVYIIRIDTNKIINRLRSAAELAELAVKISK